jgi:leucyl-tRNA synthetase
MDDPDWREENAVSIDARLKALQKFVDDIVKLHGEPRTKSVDRWLISMVQKRIKTVTAALEILKTRTAAETALFELWNDIRWYTRRAEKPNVKVLKEVADIWIRLIAPFTPHLSEELWHHLGKEGFVSLAEWPVYDETKIDVGAEEAEDLVKSLIEDTVSITRATKIVPKRIFFYVATNWKWKAYLETLRMSQAGKVEMKDIMKNLMGDQELQKKAKDLAAFLGKNIVEISTSAEDHKKRKLEAGALDEKTVIEEARAFLQKEFNAEVSVYNEEDPKKYDPRNRASQSKPYRPAIYME